MDVGFDRIFYVRNLVLVRIGIFETILGLTCCGYVSGGCEGWEAKISLDCRVREELISLKFQLEPKTNNESCSPELTVWAALRAAGGGKSAHLFVAKVKPGRQVRRIVLKNFIVRDK